MKHFGTILIISFVSWFFQPCLTNAQEKTQQSNNTIDNFSIPVKFQDMPEIKGNNIKQLEAENSKSSGRDIIDFRLVCNDVNQEKVWYYNNVPDFNPNTNNLLKLVLRSANHSRVRMEIWLNTSNGWYTASFNNVSDIWSLYTLNMAGIPVNITDIAIQISESSESSAVTEEYFHYLQLDYMEISNASSTFWSNDFSSSSGWNILATSSVASGEYSFNTRHVNDIFQYLVITGTSANSSWNNALNLAKSNTVSNHIYLDEYFTDNAHYLGFMYMVNDDNFFVKAINTNGKSYTDVVNEIGDFPATISISEGLDQYAKDVMPDHVESKVSSGEAVFFHEQNIYKENQSSISIAANSSTKLEEIVDVIAPLNQTSVKEVPIALNDPDVQNEMASAGEDPDAMTDFSLALSIVTTKAQANIVVATAYAKSVGSAALSPQNVKILNTYSKIHAGIFLAIPLTLSAMTIKEGYETNDQDKIDEGYGGLVDLGVGIGIGVAATAVVSSAVAAGVLGTAAVGSAATIAAVAGVGAVIAYSGANYAVEKKTGKSIGTHAVSASNHVRNNSSKYKASIVSNAEKSKTVINNTQTRITNSYNSASTSAKNTYNSVKTKVGESVSTAVSKITSTASTVKKWFGWGDYYYWTWDEATQQILAVSILPDYSKSTTGFDDNITDNTSFSVSQNYPNPFSGSTTIGFNLNESNNVSVKIYNLQGQLVRTLVEEQNFTQGSYSFEWEGNNDNNLTIPSGVYIYQVKTNQNLISNKLMKLN